MQVKAGGSCRDGFGGAIRQFRNPTKSCGWKAKGARSEQLMQVEAGAATDDAKKQLRTGTVWLLGRAPKVGISEGAAEGLRLLKVPKSSFGTLQKAVAGRPRESGASS